MTSRFFSLLLLLVASGPAVSAQSERIDVPWRLSYFPYLTVSPNDGVMGIARAVYFQQADWGGRLSLQRSVEVEAGYSTRDAWKGSLVWSEPLIADGWRLKAQASIGHQPRFGNPDDRVERDHAGAWLEVTRRISGPLHVAVRGAIQREKLEMTLGQHDLLYPGIPYETPPTFMAPNSTPTTIDQTTRSGRLALVLDLRDREYDVNSGALIEGGLMYGSQSHWLDTPNIGVYGHVRGWVTPRERTRVTGRVAARAMTGSEEVAHWHEMPQWETPFTTFGGPNSHRGMAVGELAGRSLLLAGLEVRHDILNVGELGAVSLLAFTDGGKSFRDRPGPAICPGPECPPLVGGEHPGTFIFTLKDWDWSYGGGIGLRVMRAAMLNITAASSDHGTRFYISSGWAW